MTRLLASALAAACLLAAAPALAGGWAVTTIDSLPSEWRAGQAHQVTYTIRQHGDKPFTGAQSAIRIWFADGTSHRFPAAPLDGPGRYGAEVTFPAAGSWSWEVDQYPFMPQALGEVTVLPAAGARAPSPISMGVVLLAALVGAGALLAVWLPLPRVLRPTP